ncbi:MAG: T9SS type A sorting domain-containing protein [Saprospiraceae bacterium]|nr:T9SS type A sorting domain-containing protein [Saprospiraceae bacterium]
MTNPVRDFIEIEIPATQFSEKIRQQLDNLEGTFTLFDQTGGVKVKEKIYSNKHRSDATGLQGGMYLIEVKLVDKRIIEKIVVIK